MGLSDVREEIPRTFFHVLGGFFLAWIGYFLPFPANRLILAAIFLGVLAVEMGRKFSPAWNRFSRNTLGVFMRPWEQYGTTGALAFTGGTALAFVVFPREVAVAALVPLVFGDRAAILAGKGFGRIRIGGKTLEGSAACFLVSFAAYMILMPFFPDPFPQSVPVLALASLIGTAAEALPRPLDDNLTIPLAVGGYLYLFNL